MTTHTGHSHPSTPAARRACREQRSLVPTASGFTSGDYFGLDRVEFSGPDADGLYLVRPMFTGVDRPDGIGYALPNKLTALRLKAALETGKLFKGLEIKTDIYGKTYAAYQMTVRARTAAADLRRLGF